MLEINPWKRIDDLELEIRSLKSNLKSSGDVSAGKTETLQDCSEKFINVAENIHAYIAFVNPLTLKYEFVNAMFEKSFGIPREKIIGQHISEIIGETNYQFALQYINLVKSGKPVTYENSFNLPGGKKWLRVSYSPINDTKGKISTIAVLGYDITEQKKSLDALQESEEKYRKIYENTGEGVAFINPEEEFVFANPAAERIFGINCKELPGKNLGEFMNSSQLLAVREQTLICKNTQKCNYEIKIKRPDGKKRNLVVTAVPQFDDNGNFMGTHVIFRDITHRKQDNLTIIHQNNELIKLIADKDRFINILAHDLKSPFSGLLGLTGVLLENLRVFDMDKIEKLLNYINKSAVSSYNLLEDLLMWTQSQSGKMPFEPKKLKFCEVFRNVVESLTPGADEKNISIECLANENLVVVSDPEMLNAILRNLISNAIKFTFENGTIRLLAETSKSQVTISVSDNGMGIKHDDLVRLFDISMVQSKQGTTGEKGTGFGLLLCKEFVEKNGGRIWVESEIGKGSSFKFTLPFYSGN